MTFKMRSVRLVMLRRKSQIQTYLEQNEGAGLQHLALLTHDIFATLAALRQRSPWGGFDFMPRPSDGKRASTSLHLPVMLCR